MWTYPSRRIARVEAQAAGTVMFCPFFICESKIGLRPLRGGRVDAGWVLYVYTGEFRLDRLPFLWGTPGERKTLTGVQRLVKDPWIF